MRARRPRILGAAAVGLALFACSRGQEPRGVAPRVGDELLGRDGRAWIPRRFVGEAPAMDGQVVVARWWTEGCPFCERSLPAIQAIVREEGVLGVAVYHPKPARNVTDDEVKAFAERVQWRGAVAVDADWAALKAGWLAGAEREATSVTFVLDAGGRVRWVHPGPELSAEDGVGLRRAVTECLGRSGAR